MKALNANSERKDIFRIDAARYSFLIIQSCFQDLTASLKFIENGDNSNQLALQAFRAAWQIIDYTFRFCSLLSQLRGLKHSDTRFKRAERCYLEVEKARNYVQHLNTTIPVIPDESYPILGTISWPAQNKTTSITLSVGSHPKGTQFRSLIYDTVKGEFVNGIILNFETFGINILKIMDQVEAGYGYLNDWLIANDRLSNIESKPSIQTFSIPPHIFARVENTHTE
jgi:hypothetical protein